MTTLDCIQDHGYVRHHLPAAIPNKQYRQIWAGKENKRAKITMCRSKGQTENPPAPFRLFDLSYYIETS